MTAPVASGIAILGTRYSERLKALYDRVAAAYAGKPIRFVAKYDLGDNTIMVTTSEIVLTLRPGSTEDNVAHELMHGVLHSEGYPQMFSINALPVSVR